MDRRQQVELTNMCLIYDENRILVEEKKGTKYAGGLGILFRNYDIFESWHNP